MRNLLSGFLYLVLLLSSGCQGNERTAMQTDQKMKTYCIGRHLFDLPDGFRPTFPLTAVFRSKDPDKRPAMISVTLLAEGINSRDFTVAVEERKKEINASTREKRNVLSETVLRGDDQALFRVSKIEDSFMSELHVLKNAVHLTAEARSYSGLFGQAENDLFAFADNVESAKLEAAPHTGFCLGDLVIRGTHEAESASITFRSDRKPDVLISIEVDTYGRDDPVALVDRVSGPSSLLEQVDVQSKVLRKGALDVVGMHGYEWLGSVMLGEHRDEKQFGFAMETKRSNPGPATPRFHIELDSGKQDRNGVAQLNSLSEQEAIALWDSIMRSIRPRRGG